MDAVDLIERGEFGDDNKFTNLLELGVKVCSF
jgi:hypothetical protein